MKLICKSHSSILYVPISRGWFPLLTVERSMNGDDFRERRFHCSSGLSSKARPVAPPCFPRNARWLHPVSPVALPSVLTAEISHHLYRYPVRRKLKDNILSPRRLVDIDALVISNFFFSCHERSAMINANPDVCTAPPVPRPGTIPPEIWDLNELERFELWVNNIHGAILTVS